MLTIRAVIQIPSPLQPEGTQEGVSSPGHRCRPENQLTRYGRHVCTWRLAPRTQFRKHLGLSMGKTSTTTAACSSCARTGGGFISLDTVGAVTAKEC